MRFTVDLPNVEGERRGPYLSDRDDQPFAWSIQLDGESIAFEPPTEPFGLNVFWRRPGREPIWLTADAGGRYDDRSGAASFSLADELLRARLERNRTVRERYQRAGFSAPVALSEQINRASAVGGALGTDATPAAREAGLGELIDAGEALELAYAASRPVNERQRVGCDVRQMYLTHPERFRAHFNHLFDYATVVFYVKSRAYEYFEPTEGEYRYELRDLVRAEVPFEVSGVQLYRPYRDLSDIVRAAERYEALGKSVYMTEVGVPGTDDGVYAWTPESQADWAEKVYRALMPRPGVGGLLWYDFSDRGAFLPKGGLVDEDAQPKPAYERIERLLIEAGRIPEAPTDETRPADRATARAVAVTD